MTAITVTSANSSTGCRLLDRLAATSAEVSALVRRSIDLPATRIIPDWTSAPAALDAIRTADVIIHLSGVFSGDWAQHHAGTVATAERVAAAARLGQRLVYLSYTDADPEAANWYERAKGRAEQALLGSAANTLILRIPPILYGPSAPGAFEQRMLPAPGGGPVTVLGDGTRRFRPLFSGDIVEALVAAVVTDVTGTYDLVGPEDLTVDQIVRRINGPDVPIKYLTPEAARRIPAIPPSVIDMFTKPGRDTDPVTAWRLLGLSPTPLETIWSRSA